MKIPKSLHPSSLVAESAAGVAVPVVLPVLGLGARGISFGSLAAKGMSFPATTGYGMPVVSCLHSVGATRMIFAQSVKVATVVTSGFQAAVGRLLGKGSSPNLSIHPIGSIGTKTTIFAFCFGVTAAVAVPQLVADLGFGAGGITVGSLAAKVMSLAATTGCGIPVVSLLQSVGAAGMTFAQDVTVATAAAVVTSGFQAAGGRLLKRGAGGPQGNPVDAQGRQPGKNEPETDERATQLLNIIVPVAVGVTAVMAVPVVVGGLGFGAGGIAAGSLAAKGMSLAATTGYGMPIVSCLQSVGAAGMTFAQGVTVATVTAGTKAGVGRLLGWGQE